MFISDPDLAFPSSDLDLVGAAYMTYMPIYINCHESYSAFFSAPANMLIIIVIVKICQNRSK